MAINWSLGQTPNIIGNALAAYDSGRQQRQQQDYQNALLGQRQQQIDAQQATQQREAYARELAGRAANGDRGAMAELAGIDINAYDKLDTNQHAALKTRVDYIGNAALQISQLPPEQRAGAWDAAIDQAPNFGVDGLDEYRGKYSEQALHGALSSSGNVAKFIDMNRPSYQAIPAGGTLVNTHDPAAVRQFQGGAPQAQSGPQPGTIEDGYRFKGGNPADPNAWEQVGGPAPQASGGFP